MNVLRRLLIVGILTTILLIDEIHCVKYDQLQAWIERYLKKYHHAVDRPRRVKLPRTLVRPTRMMMPKRFLEDDDSRPLVVTTTHKPGLGRRYMVDPEKRKLRRYKKKGKTLNAQ
ncbi:hypothetical protein LSH36_497g00057 [Paralvinella palmiformis]|uniref:Uncharacterized protein n=1 Tax=Paralvinella palmiformis TaxID=53620 RepID=A0AAD9MY27_9ANNE|nr:hypothetical protein LSH36_497g00057 [Paralvinella palmiformis]